MDQKLNLIRKKLWNLKTGKLPEVLCRQNNLQQLLWCNCEYYCCLYVC